MTRQEAGNKTNITEICHIAYCESLKKTSQRREYMWRGGEKLCARPVVVLPVSVGET